MCEREGVFDAEKNSGGVEGGLPDCASAQAEAPAQQLMSLLDHKERQRRDRHTSKFLLFRSSFGSTRRKGAQYW